MKHTYTQKDLAEKWQTSQMTISNYAKQGCPFSGSDKEVARWLNTHSKKKSAPMKAVIDAVLKPEPVTLPDGHETKTLEQMRDYYSDQLDAATRSSETDHELIRFWNDLLLKADESIRRSQAHEKKLNLTNGELISRPEMERILRNMAWAGNACCDKFSKQIAQRLSDKKPAEVHKILKPTLTALLVFEGMNRLAKVPGDINLPQWVIDCMQTEGKNYFKVEE